MKPAATKAAAKKTRSVARGSAAAGTDARTGTPGGSDAGLERRRHAREEGGGEDYGGALQRAVGGAGILGSTHYQGGTIH
ncbi:MAG: hypothetical protein ACOY37_12995 [Pseudomonadota bacterium]